MFRLPSQRQLFVNLSAGLKGTVVSVSVSKVKKVTMGLSICLVGHVPLTKQRVCRSVCRSDCRFVV